MHSYLPGRTSHFSSIFFAFLELALLFLALNVCLLLGLLSHFGGTLSPVLSSEMLHGKYIFFVTLRFLWPESIFYLPDWLTLWECNYSFKIILLKTLKALSYFEDPFLLVKNSTCHSNFWFFLHVLYFSFVESFPS